MKRKRSVVLKAGKIGYSVQRHDGAIKEGGVVAFGGWFGRLGVPGVGPGVVGGVGVDGGVVLPLPMGVPVRTFIGGPV